MTKIILLVIAAIMFALLGLNIAVGALNMLAWGLFFVVVSLLPWKD